MALRGDLSKISDLKSKLRTLPTTVAVDVARRAAPAMTTLTDDAYQGGRSVYGEPRAVGKDGSPLTLNRTGATAAQLRFVSNGTIVRCVLGPKYAKYLIGKYGILPNGPLPAEWSARLQALVRETKVPL